MSNVGTYGTLDGGATLPGHVLSARMDATGAWSDWNDLTISPVSNDNVSMNATGMGISSLFVDPHDTSGNTIYATVAGISQWVQYVATVYGSIDGGAHWTNLVSNLPASAANSLVIDPQDANTAYVALDLGVWFTRNVSTCGTGTACWAPFGAGLPNAPVVGLSAAPARTTPNVLAAGTFGRGVWQIPLATAGAQLTTATLLPASLDFGNQGYNIASSPLAVILTNTGGIALLPGAISVTGDFSETDDCSGETVNAGARCTIQITFKPTQAGARTGTLTVPANVEGGALAVGLSGTGDTPGAITITPPGSYDFGQVKVGTTPPPHGFSVENSGGTAVAITSITVTDPFALAVNTCGDTLSPGSDCELKVEFSPTASGAAAGVLTIVDDQGTQTVDLKGTGAAPPTGTLSPNSLTFPGTIIGQSSASQTVTLTNSGDLPLTSISVALSAPFYQTNDCTEQLAPKASCYVTVVFKPTDPGSVSGNLTESDVINASQVVGLSGTGLIPPQFSVSPVSLTFAAQQVGVGSTPQALTVKNIGEVDAANVDIAIAGEQPAGSFSIPAGTKTCGSTLAAGATCTLQVVFKPVSAGGATATLMIDSSNAKQFPGVPIQGTGQTAAGLNVSPAQVTFAAQDLNKASAAQTVTVTNSGGTSAAGLALNVTGPFSLAQNNCGASLAAGASCTTGVVFTPVSRGVLTGTLTITASNVTAPATVSLSGTGGLTGAVQITPAQVSFPVTGVGATSSPTTLTISNSSTTVALAELSLAVSAGFELGNNTCGTSVAAGASCTVDVSFAPSATGPQNGSLSLASSALAATVTVPLSGMGFDFQATTTGATSLTVSSGQTATYTLTLAPSSGSSATFTLQCGKLPSYAACTFNPSSPGVAAGATGTVSLQITTSQGSSAAVRPWGLGRWQDIPALAAILMWPLARRRRRGLFLALLVMLFVFSAGLTACSSSGGGGGGITPPPVTHTTPAGTYSIPVNVGANGVQHTVTVTLVVD